MLTESLTKKIKEYISWEKTLDFSGWEEIEVFLAPTLSDAWIKARPNDAYKFENEAFKVRIDNANGKWLEKQFPEDKYKVIVALGTEFEKTEDELCKVILHELRHCLDYQKAVKNLTFDEYHSGNQYYCDWSEYRAVIASVRYSFFLEHKYSRKSIFKILSEILGYWSADCVEGLLCEKKPEDILYYLSRYIGASRAILNLSKEYEIGHVFDTWIMTPTNLTVTYENILYYIGEEWNKLEECSLDAEPQTCHYKELLKRVHRYR